MRLIEQLKRLKVETGSLACLGCGQEHNCSVHGCAIINEAIRQLEEKETVVPAKLSAPKEPFAKVMEEKAQELERKENNDQ